MPSIQLFEIAQILHIEGRLSMLFAFKARFGQFKTHVEGQVVDLQICTLRGVPSTTS